jgi:hypothetical protein
MIRSYFTRLVGFFRRPFEWPNPPRPLDPTENFTNARMAEALLADPMLAAVLFSLKEKAVRDWQLSEPSEIERQHIAHMRVTILRDILRELHGHINSAKKLGADLEQVKRANQAKEIGQSYLA